MTSPKLDAVSEAAVGFDRPLGHPMELVPLVNPVTATGPGQKIRVKLLYQGKPLPEARDFTTNNSRGVSTTRSKSRSGSDSSWTLQVNESGEGAVWG